MLTCSERLFCAFFHLCKPALERSEPFSGSGHVLWIDNREPLQIVRGLLWLFGWPLQDTEMWSTLDHRPTAPPELNTVLAVLPTNLFKQGSSAGL